MTTSWILRVVHRDRIGLYVNYEGGRFRPRDDTSRGPGQQVKLGCGLPAVVDEHGSFVTLLPDERWYYDGHKRDPDLPKVTRHRRVFKVTRQNDVVQIEPELEEIEPQSDADRSFATHGVDWSTKKEGL